MVFVLSVELAAAHMGGDVSKISGPAPERDGADGTTKGSWLFVAARSQKQQARKCQYRKKLTRSAVG
jgi:hypothetical protein